MHGIALTLISVALTAALIALLTDYFYTSWLLYYLFGELLHRLDWLHSVRTRQGPLARRAAKFCDVEFSPLSVQRLQALDANKKYVFALEPHAQWCLHMVFMAACGSVLPDALAPKIRVVAHWMSRTLPLIRDVLSLYGVIDNRATSINTALAANNSIAIVPSGLTGKEHAMLDPPPHPNDRPLRVPVYRRKQIGFLYLAVKHKAAIVPVLSPDELSAFDLYWRHWRIWLFTLARGKYFIAPLRPVRIHVGEPIDTSAYNIADAQSMTTLANLYYNQLAALAPPEYRVEIQHANE